MSGHKMEWGILALIRKKIRDYLTRTSLKNILLWLFLPVFILCILGNLFLTNVMVRRLVKENATASILTMVSQTNQYLYYRLSLVFEQMVLFEQSPDFAVLVTAAGDVELKRMEHYVKAFNRLQQLYYDSYSVLESVLLAVQRGSMPTEVIYQSYYSPNNVDFSFSMILNGEPLIDQGTKSYQWYNLHRNTIYPNIYTDNQTASLYKMIGDKNSPSRSFLLFNFKNQFFRQIFGDTQVTRNGYLALLDNKAIMHFSPQGNRYGTGEDILRLIEDDKRDSGSLTFRTKDHSQMLVIWESLKLGDWKLAAILPEADLMTQVGSLRFITVICSLLAIVFALILSLLVIRLISNPIARWVSKIGGLSSGSDDILLDDVICAETMELNRGIIRLMNQVRRLAREKLTEQDKKRELEIRILHEQIKPHFLYNALYSVEQLSLMGEYEKMTGIIRSLTGYYRLSLSKGRDLIELKNEIGHAEYYLSIQMIQSKKISYTLDIENNLRETKIVKLSLQPLLENAIFHAMKHEEDLCLRIRGEKIGGDLKIDVEDNGVGMPEEKTSALNRAFTTDDWQGLNDVYGLRNVHERLRLHYGVPYGLSIRSIPEEGTTVSILVPFSGGGGDKD
jgi:two-component system sensor histidine kinase YesM